ncbi:MAG: cell division protein FtsZ [Ignavibacterium sp.]|nr:cell division protein FtsZ [Ignavibacterium sp.]MDW8375385.1 cell division protein FtsZ [Ignavibacteriales bacterium]
MSNFTNSSQINSPTRFATIDKVNSSPAVLKVVGVGGAGGNAIESMIQRGIQGVEFIAVNTDVQHLARSSAHTKIQIGAKITRGMGAGADPNTGKDAAKENEDEIRRVLTGSDMVFITCGEGGGTGTGASPLIASIAKSLGALVIGIVSTPFSWEGKTRIENAKKGIAELKKYVDSLIEIPNERILSIIDKNTPFKVALDKANEILYEATRGISDIINLSGFINVDFADVRTIMNMSGDAIIGCGIASGENRAADAARKAISSPLLNGVSIKGSKGILINVTGPSNMTMEEINEGNKIIVEEAGLEANIIFGVVIRDDLAEDYISYTVIATGFNNKNNGFNNNFTNNKNGNEKRKQQGGTTRFLDFLRGDDSIDKNNLDTPTILRFDPNSRIDDTPNDDDNFWKFNNDDKNNNSKNNRRDDDDDDDEGSDFLRKIMD